MQTGTDVEPNATEEGGSVGTGAIVGTVIGTVVVFGGGAFALIWFVLRKKYL